MSIFKENLTSKLLQEASIKIVNKKNSISKILELGVGTEIFLNTFSEIKIKKILYVQVIFQKKQLKLQKKNLNKKLISKAATYSIPGKARNLISSLVMYLVLTIKLHY